MKSKLARAFLFVASIAFMPNSADAEPPQGEAYCAPESETLSIEAQLRALSLDLRGVVPTVAEYDEVRDAAALEARVHAWTGTEAFAARVGRRHRALLWNNVTNVRLIRSGSTIGETAGTTHLWYSRPRSREYRGALAACRNEPVRYDANGAIVTTPGTVLGQRVQQEGYVEVHPWWALDTTIKVCAFDARADLRTPSGEDCSIINGLTQRHCGCGPNLTFCTPLAAQDAMTDAMGREVEERVRAMVRGGGHYGELFTSRRAFINGPLSHLYRHVAPQATVARIEPLAIPLESIPDLPYAQQAWVEIELPPGHAGILTSPAWLLRFQTNRARASRFASEFLCSPYVAPEGGIPIEPSDASTTDDLQLRTGCRDCHRRLEPNAARWGRWTEQGAGHLDLIEYPARREDCYQCAIGEIPCSPECNLRYFTSTASSEARPFLGMLNAYAFRAPEHVARIDEGPIGAYRDGLADGTLPRCVATRTVEWLLGRSPTVSESAWVDELTQDFVASDLNYTQLVTSVALSSTYRRAQ